MKFNESKTPIAQIQAQKQDNQPFFSPEGQDGVFALEKPFFSAGERSSETFFKPHSPIIQTKLTIGAPNDVYEQEADAMADKVVQRLAQQPTNDNQQGGETLSEPSAVSRQPLAVQRKCAECGQEEKNQEKEELNPVGEQLQRKSIFECNNEPPEDQGTPVGGGIQRKCAGCGKEMEEIGGGIQRKPSGEMTASPDVASRLSASKGAGCPLPENTRSSMESAFGADFSGVRIHTGSEAVQMSRDLSAQAFTHGSDVYFGAGKFSPVSTDGQRLLGHELTHVVQQNNQKRIQRFVSSEHRSLGDLSATETPVDFPEGTLFKGPPASPALSYGEIVALSGDFYGSFESLANPNFIDKEGKPVKNSTERKVKEINHLKRLFQVETEIRKEGHEPEGLDTGNVKHKGEMLEGFEKTTGGRYLALAEKNFPHFTVADTNNIATWMAGHRLALQEAFSAGIVGSEQQKLLALARNAAANHFMTDAFAAGHMRVPRSDIDRYYRDLMAKVAPGLAAALLEKLPTEISVTIDLRPFLPPEFLPVIVILPGISELLRYTIRVEFRSKVAAALEPHLQRYTGIMRENVGPKLGGLVSKWLHDTDNKNGLLVTNKAGARWMAYGDSSLDKAPPTGSNVNSTNRKEAENAVRADRQEVEDMYKSGQVSKKEKVENATSGSIPDAVYFNFDKPKTEHNVGALSATNRAQLNQLVQYLGSVSGVTVILSGWADSRGSKEYNEALSRRRISAVSAYLLNAGVSQNKIGKPIIHGEPLVDTSAANHHLYRRVDIHLKGKPSPLPNNDTKGKNKKTLAPVPEQFAAERFLPRVETGNPAMAPYEWCKLDEFQKAGLRNGMIPTMKSGLLEMLEASVQDALPENFEINVRIPIPLYDDIHIKKVIPIQETLMQIATPIINKAINGVMSEAIFGKLMDGSCSLSELQKPKPDAA